MDEPALRERQQLGFGCSTGRADGRDDAAAGLGDVLVARALQPQLELVRAVAGVDEMRVAIDEAGQEPRAARVVLVARLVFPSGTRADPGNATLRNGECAVHDGAMGRHGRELGIQPDGVMHLAMITA